MLARKRALAPAAASAASLAAINCRLVSSSSRRRRSRCAVRSPTSRSRLVAVWNIAKPALPSSRLRSTRAASAALVRSSRWTRWRSAAISARAASRLSGIGSAKHPPRARLVDVHRAGLLAVRAEADQPVPREQPGECRPQAERLGFEAPQNALGRDHQARRADPAAGFVEHALEV